VIRRNSRPSGSTSGPAPRILSIGFIVTQPRREISKENAREITTVWAVAWSAACGWRAPTRRATMASPPTPRPIERLLTTQRTVMAMATAARAAEPSLPTQYRSVTWYRLSMAISSVIGTPSAQMALLMPPLV